MLLDIKKILLYLMICSLPGFAQVPTFTLRSLDGEWTSMDDHLGKGPVVLEFWATWCKPCVKNLPKLQKIEEKYGNRGLQIFAINEDGPRSMSKVGPFVNSLGLSFPVLMDENRDVMRKYNAPGLPTTVLIDKNKKLVFTLNGYRPGDEKKLEQEIEKLLGDQSE